MCGTYCKEEHTVHPKGGVARVEGQSGKDRDPNEAESHFILRNLIVIIVIKAKQMYLGFYIFGFICVFVVFMVIYNKFNFITVLHLFYLLGFCFHPCSFVYMQDYIKTTEQISIKLS